ncbi:MAG: dihydrofolate reductase [Bacteroidetes bacterium HGW-Bacteroidetes-21]|nr:MAG: dihydrofolate reductase [Bacteroidetes bacterium HGW-Bacteroidetes-21]
MKNLLILIIMTSLAMACSEPQKETVQENKPTEDTMKYLLEQFADIKIIRYTIPGWDSLTLKQKELVYYLSQAALCGRDIIFDQNYKYNLTIRKTLEAIVNSYQGDKNSEAYKKIMIYTKRVWFSNGIHHHYSNDKFFPETTKEEFVDFLKNSNTDEITAESGETKEAFIARITDIIYNPAIAPKKVSLDSFTDLIKASSSNFYEGVSQKEVEKYYADLKLQTEAANGKMAENPISYGLNSKLVKENGKVVEKVYKKDGLYGKAIEKIIYWLEKAASVAENDAQKNHLNKLIEYYSTGNLKTWDDYNVLWVSDLSSQVDYVNGFIEVYDDPMGMKATWESVVNFKDIEATKRTEKISSSAKWFEDNSPVAKEFKKKEVKGVSAKVITVAQLGGACYPTTPIGINLPNANWIRKEHGSKSVTMENITYAYSKSALGNGVLEEFCFSPEEIERTKKYGSLADNLHTDLHECLGHGSGQMLPGVSDGALKNYHSALEESRADLFALYYLLDPKMIELGLFDTIAYAYAEYDKYIRNGLMMQLTRIDPGKNIEQAHMRCRSLIAHWCYEKGQPENVIEKKIKDGKTYFVVNDYKKLQILFGNLLAEIQRIKSTGDYEAGKTLVENYAVQVDPELHKEVLERYSKLNVAPYGGFVNPEFELQEENGVIKDIKVLYPVDYTQQMLNYSKNFSLLPTVN